MNSEAELKAVLFGKHFWSVFSLKKVKCQKRAGMNFATKTQKLAKHNFVYLSNETSLQVLTGSNNGGDTQQCFAMLHILKP